MAPYIQPHVNYLIGVDINEVYLQKAVATGIYQEVILSNLETFVPPEDVDIAFLLEVIEHLPKLDGALLLFKLANIPNIVITTPRLYWRNVSFGGPHLSLWRISDFTKYGFEAYFSDFFHVVATKFS